MKRALGLFLVAGLGLAIGLVGWFGLDAVVAVLARGGPGLLWLVPVHLPVILFAGLAWGALFPPGRTPGFGVLMAGSWIGLSVNWLLPVAQVGGEIVKTRLAMQAGSGGLAVGGPEAGAAMVADKTVQAATQLLFPLVGLALLVASFGEAGLVPGVVLFTLLLGAGLWGFWRVQKAGLFGLLERLAGKLPGRPGAMDGFGGAAALDAALHAVWGRRRRVLVSVVWRMAYRLGMAVEVWLAMELMGHPVTVVEAVILQSLGQAVRAAAFMVPGGLGIQEGGFVVLGALLGIPPETALALSLAKRFRELAVGLPGLLAWQGLEGRRLFRRDDGGG